MSRREVRETGKNAEGDITSLCDPGQWWSPRQKADAIADIENGVHDYWVPWSGAAPTVIRVVNDRVKGKYLRTDRDTTTRNNLDDLPNC